MDRDMVVLSIPRFEIGQVIHTSKGETRIDSYLGLIAGKPTYQVTTVEIDGYGHGQTNTFRMTFGYRLILDPK